MTPVNPSGPGVLFNPKNGKRVGRDALFMREG